MGPEIPTVLRIGIQIINTPIEFASLPHAPIRRLHTEHEQGLTSCFYSISFVRRSCPAQHRDVTETAEGENTELLNIATRYCRAEVLQAHGQSKDLIYY